MRNLAELEQEANELLKKCTEQAALLTQQRTKAIAEVEQKNAREIGAIGYS